MLFDLDAWLGCKNIDKASHGPVLFVFFQQNSTRKKLLFTAIEKFFTFYYSEEFVGLMKHPKTENCRYQDQLQK